MAAIITTDRPNAAKPSPSLREKLAAGDEG
jgi:hypothetical protein